MLKFLTPIILAIILGYGTNQVKSHFRENITQHKSSESTPLYLPQAKHLKLITFGFEHFVSDIIWFRSINYFGKQLSKKESIPWLAHMCDLVTDLNPKSATRYDFCSSLVSWVAKDPKSTVKLLTRAIAHNPNYWRYYYIRGFNYWYFLDDIDRAAKDFKKGASLEDAPLFLGTLASKLLSKDPNQSIIFLENMIKNTKDKNAIKALEDNLKLAYVSRDIALIKKAANIYEQRNSKKAEKMTDLVQHKLIAFVTKDPYGDKYYIDDLGQILS